MYNNCKTNRFHTICQGERKVKIVIYISISNYTKEGGSFCIIAPPIKEPIKPKNAPVPKPPLAWLDNEVNPSFISSAFSSKHLLIFQK